MLGGVFHASLADLNGCRLKSSSVSMLKPFGGGHGPDERNSMLMSDFNLGYRWSYLESKEMKGKNLYTKGPHGQMP